MVETDEPVEAAPPTPVDQVVRWLRATLATTGADAAVVLAPTLDGTTLDLVAAVGYPPEVIDSWPAVDCDRAFPLCDAARGASPVYLPDKAAISDRYPSLARQPTWGASALAALPLLCGERLMGVLGLSFWDPTPLGETDRIRLETIAFMLAELLHQAAPDHSGSAAARPATSLDVGSPRRGYLPPALPEVPGVDLAADVVHGSATAVRALYDLFRIEPQRWGVLVGEISGDPETAAVGANQLRHLIRGAAHSEPRPARVLTGVNRGLVSGGLGSGSAAYGRFHLRPNGTMHLRLAGSGHPTPLLVRGQGTVQPIRLEGPSLGDPALRHLREELVILDPGDVIVFTSRPVADGQLAELLGSQTWSSAAEVVDAVLRAGRSGRRAAPPEDLVVLAIRLDGQRRRTPAAN